MWSLFFLLVCFLFLFSFSKRFLCVAQAGLELKDNPASASWVRGIKGVEVWATTTLPCFTFNILNLTNLNFYFIVFCFVLLLFLCFLRQGLTMWSWQSWNSQSSVCHYLRVLRLKVCTAMPSFDSAIGCAKAPFKIRLFSISLKNIADPCYC